MITMKAISKFRMMKALSDDDENCDNGIDYDTYINFQHIWKGKTTDIFVNIFDLILFMPERGNLTKIVTKKTTIESFRLSFNNICGYEFSNISWVVLPQDHSGRALPVSHIPASWTNHKFGLHPVWQYVIARAVCVLWHCLV